MLILILFTYFLELRGYNVNLAVSNWASRVLHISGSATGGGGGGIAPPHDFFFFLLVRSAVSHGHDDTTPTVNENFC